MFWQLFNHWIARWINLFIALFLVSRCLNNYNIKHLDTKTIVWVCFEIYVYCIRTHSYSTCVKCLYNTRYFFGTLYKTRWIFDMPSYLYKRRINKSGYALLWRSNNLQYMSTNRTSRLNNNLLLLKQSCYFFRFEEA